MQILIIGATGMIGRALVRELQEAGHIIIASSRNPEKAKQALTGTIDIRAWDGKSVVSLMEILAGTDGVVNLAGENIANGLWTRKRKQKLSGSRIDTGRTLTDSILQMEQRPSFLIQGSASGFYGPDVVQSGDENLPEGAGFLAELTRKWEQSVHLMEETGMRVVYLRTGIVLDPDAGMLKKMLLPFRFYAGTVAGSGKQWISWIHIRDQVRAIRFLIENHQSAGPYNLTAPEPVRMSDFVAAISTILQKPAWMKIPGFLLQAAMGQMAGETILSSQRLIPRKLLNEGFTFQFDQIEIALKDLLKRETTP